MLLSIAYDVGICYGLVVMSTKEDINSSQWKSVVCSRASDSDECDKRDVWCWIIRPSPAKTVSMPVAHPYYILSRYPLRTLLSLCIFNRCEGYNETIKIGKINLV